MSKYIDADKLIEAIEEIKKAEYENCGGVNAKTGVLQEVQELITSFQQEQPEVDLKKYKKYDEALAIAKAWYKSSASSAQERNVARMIMGDIVMD